MSSGNGSVRGLWLRWKTLRLPWRKEWLVGSDLAGNTFWEFKEALNAPRMRRIVRYNQKVHHADVKLTPAWVQWLRHTRPSAPSLEEQQMDEVRQRNMQVLAAAADARWAEKASYLKKPEEDAGLVGAAERSLPPQPGLEQGDRGEVSGVSVSDGADVRVAGKGAGKKNKTEESPWVESEKTKERAPEAWKPTVPRRS